MQYYMHKDLGHVVSLDDDEPADLDHLGGDADLYMPVHLHPGPGSMHREPGVLAKIIVSALALAIVAAIAGLAAWAWTAALR